MRKLADPAEVEEQYRDSSKLDARVRLYELYATNPQPWLCWLFERLRFAPSDRVLEVGCGMGNLWRDNAERVPDDIALTLSDLSPGMLEEAARRLAGLRERNSKIRFEHFDVQSIPFEDASFDVAIANHMLYHVPDRARALCEIQRVLVPGGRFYVGTNDWTHLLELREMVLRFELEGAMVRLGRDPQIFDFETAAEELSQHFPSLTLHRRRDVLAVTEAEPLIAYARTMISESAGSTEAFARLERHIRRQLELVGSVQIGASVGVFEAV